MSKTKAYKYFTQLLEADHFKHIGSLDKAHLYQAFEEAEKKTWSKLNSAAVKANHNKFVEIKFRRNRWFYNRKAKAQL